MNEENTERKPTERGYALKKIVRENKFYTCFMAFLLLWLPITTAIDITAVENGTKQRESVLAPVAFLYNWLGYWPAVLLLPLLYVLLIGYIIYKITSGRK